MFNFLKTLHHFIALAFVLLLLCIGLAGNWALTILALPASPMSRVRIRSRAQCHHRVFFAGGYFAEASAA